MTRELDDRDYQQLLAFRIGLRRFLRWSEAQARAAGLTPAQHQLLLAVRGHGHRAGPRVGDLADALGLRHHSTVELIDRAAEAGLIERSADPADRRVVRVRLTEAGREKIAALSALHRDELARLRPRMAPIWEGLGAPGDATEGGPQPGSSEAGA